MSEIPVFVNHGGIPTAEGALVLGYIEGLREDAGRNVAKLNALPGAVKHYIAMTSTAMTPAEWLEENRLGNANIVYDMMMALQESEAQKEQTNDIAGQLAKLSETVAGLVAKMAVTETTAAEMVAEPVVVETPKKAKKAKAETPEEAEDEDEPEADEPSTEE